VDEVLSSQVLGELRQTTARPGDDANLRTLRFNRTAKALAHAVLALADDEPEAAVEHANYAKRQTRRSAAVRETLGLALYRSGSYREARAELNAAQRLSGTADLAAVLADIERALGRPERAIELFEGTDRSAMSDDAAAELLLVAASAYGDMDRPASGVALIRRHGAWPAKLLDHHLRLAYAQGTLAEQAGDTATARQALTRVITADPDFFDAAERLERLTGG
jgi:tetratricopeptide (TPR) repeat protein